MRGLPTLALAASLAAVTQAALLSASAGGGEPRLDLEDGSLAIEYVAHACFRIHLSDGQRVVIDPYASDVWIGYDFPDVRELEADAVLVSHPHYDHDAGVSVGKDFPWKDAKVLRDVGTAGLGKLEIKGIRGRHAKDYGRSFGHKNTIWLLDVDGIRIAHLGDNGPLTDQNAKDLGRVDILMIPVDAREHILTFDEIESIRTALEPRVLIPMHYRIPEIEPRSAESLDLGNIDPWLAARKNVRRLASNTRIVSADGLPDEEEIWVFPHSPKVPR